MPDTVWVAENMRLDRLRISRKTKYYCSAKEHSNEMTPGDILIFSEQRLTQPSPEKLLPAVDRD